MKNIIVISGIILLFLFSYSDSYGQKKGSKKGYKEQLEISEKKAAGLIDSLDKVSKENESLLDSLAARKKEIVSLEEKLLSVEGEVTHLEIETNFLQTKLTTTKEELDFVSLTQCITILKMHKSTPSLFYKGKFYTENSIIYQIVPYKGFLTMYGYQVELTDANDDGYVDNVNLKIIHCYGKNIFFERKFTPCCAQGVLAGFFHKTGATELAGSSIDQFPDGND